MKRIQACVILDTYLLFIYFTNHRGNEIAIGTYVLAAFKFCKETDWIKDTVATGFRAQFVHSIISIFILNLTTEKANPHPYFQFFLFSIPLT